MAKKANSNKKRDGFSFIMLIAIFMIAAIGVMGYFMSRGNSPNTENNFVKIPLISQPVTSNSGRSHSVEVEFTVELSEAAKSNFPNDEVYNLVNETVKNMDYDKLSKHDGIDYLENIVKDSLNESYEDFEFSNVYVGNISIDHPGLLSAPKKESQDSRAKLKGLFKNLK